MSTKEAQWRLFKIWWTLGGLLLLFVAAQSIFGRFGTRTKDAWDWLAPNIAPTLALVTGVVLALRAEWEKRTAPSKSLFWAQCFSVVYLCLLALPFVLPLVVPSGPFELMEISDLWLGIVQGAVAAFLGVFFARSATEQPA